MTDCEEVKDLELLMRRRAWLKSICLGIPIIVLLPIALLVCLFVASVSEWLLASEDTGTELLSVIIPYLLYFPFLIGLVIGSVLLARQDPQTPEWDVTQMKAASTLYAGFWGLLFIIISGRLLLDLLMLYQTPDVNGEIQAQGVIEVLEVLGVLAGILMMLFAFMMLPLTVGFWKGLALSVRMNKKLYWRSWAWTLGGLVISLFTLGCVSSAIVNDEAGLYVSFFLVFILSPVTFLLALGIAVWIRAIQLMRGSLFEIEQLGLQQQMDEMGRVTGDE